MQQTLTQLRKTKPLVLCLTNHVTMDLMANALLCLGAAPIMTEETRELDELIQICHAITLNIGTLDEAFIQRAKVATEIAKKYSKPIILDPVGAGATAIRTETARLFAPHADIIRGNASEIMAITDVVHETLGVEATHCVSDAEHSARLIAQKHQTTVVVSGPVDYITDSEIDAHLPFGSPLMPYVTGMGCTLTAVIAAFRAILPSSFRAAKEATTYFGCCGQLTAMKTNNPGSFRTLFLDELYQANINAMMELPHAT